MPSDSQSSKLLLLRDQVVTIAIAGGAQILLALAVWPLVFRRQPQGFALALTLIGFGNWGLSALSSFGWGKLRRRAVSGTPAPRSTSPITTRMQEQLERGGCGFMLFLSSFVPLGLAFVIRVRADLASGWTWRELFPPLP